MASEPETNHPAVARAFVSLADPRVRERIRVAEERVRVGDVDESELSSSEELGAMIDDLRHRARLPLPVEDP